MFKGGHSIGARFSLKIAICYIKQAQSSRNKYDAYTKYLYHLSKNETYFGVLWRTIDSQIVATIDILS